MRLNYAVSVETIITGLLLLGTMLGVYVRLNERMARLEEKMSMIYDWWLGHHERKAEG